MRVSCDVFCRSKAAIRRIGSLMIDIESLEDSVPTRHRQFLANDRKWLVCVLRYSKVFLLMFFPFSGNRCL